MATTQYAGSNTLIIGATAVGSYLIDTADGDNEVVQEDIITGTDGTIASRLVFQIMPMITLNLVAKSGATPWVDFPKGLKCALTGTYTPPGSTVALTLSNMIVEECKVSNSKSAQRVTVTLKSIGV